MRKGKESDRNKILSLIQENNQRKNSTIADLAGISEPHVGRIIRATHLDGTIIGDKSIINPLKMGLFSVGYVLIKVLDFKETPRKITVEHIRSWPNVQEIHYTNGEYDILVKVRFSRESSRINFLDYITNQGNISSTQSISLIETVLETLDVSIGEYSDGAPSDT